MKARQLSLFKAEAKTFVSSPCCGTAFVLFKKSGQNEGQTIIVLKSKAKQTVSSTCCGPALTDFKYKVKMKARQVLFDKAIA
jgi:hypothetical protein